MDRQANKISIYELFTHSLLPPAPHPLSPIRLRRSHLLLPAHALESPERTRHQILPPRALPRGHPFHGSQSPQIIARPPRTLFPTVPSYLATTLPPPSPSRNMRSSPLILAFSAAALAQDQVPLVDKLKGWYSQATAVVTNAVPAVPHVPSPADAARGKVADQLQTELSLENWKEVLTVDPTASTPTTQEWLVYITGGNTTCYGLCGNTTKAWNVSALLHGASGEASSRLSYDDVITRRMITC